jgi:hypothetical protein
MREILDTSKDKLDLISHSVNWGKLGGGVIVEIQKVGPKKVRETIPWLLATSLFTH